MRPLTDAETQKVYEKLAHYVGEKVSELIRRTDGKYVFRFNRDRVFYVREDVLKVAQHVGRKELLSCGTCFGRFSKKGIFRLHITSLDYLSSLASNKVWLKEKGEQKFLYGHHVLKQDVERVTDDIQQHAGVIVYSSINPDMALGFGIAGKNSAGLRAMDPLKIAVIHQGDRGEYIRTENVLV